MPKSSKLVADVEQMLQLGGAKVTGQIELEDSYVDPKNNSTLIDLAEQSLNTATVAGLPANSNGVETSAALLTALLMDHTPAVPASARSAILGAFADKQFLTQKANVTQPAEAVVFLAPPPYVDAAASDENQNLLTIATQFRKGGPVLVGSAGAVGSGNVVDGVAGDATLSKTISTVDNIDTQQGRVAAVLALNEQIFFNRTGHYGVASSATSLLPKWPEQ